MILQVHLQKEEEVGQGKTRRRAFQARISWCRGDSCEELGVSLGGPVRLPRVGRGAGEDGRGWEPGSVPNAVDDPGPFQAMRFQGLPYEVAGRSWTLRAECVRANRWVWDFRGSLMVGAAKPWSRAEQDGRIRETLWKWIQQHLGSSGFIWILMDDLVGIVAGTVFKSQCTIFRNNDKVKEGRDTFQS